MHSAVRAHDPTLMIRLGRQGHNLNEIAGGGYSVWVGCVRHPDLAFVAVENELIKYDVYDDHGCLPLEYAIEFSDNEALVLDLIHHGAKVNGNNADDAVGILLAARGHPEMLKCLLEHGANANLFGEKGKTAFQYIFTSWGYSESAKSLREEARQMMRYGADPRLKTRDGKTIIDLATAEIAYRSKHGWPKDDAIITLAHELYDSSRAKR